MPPADDSMESTLMISESAAAELSKGLPERPGTDDGLPTPATETDAADTAPAPLDTGLDDIPLPSILSGLSRSEEKAAGSDAGSDEPVDFAAVENRADLSPNEAELAAPAGDAGPYPAYENAGSAETAVPVETEPDRNGSVVDEFAATIVSEPLPEISAPAVIETPDVTSSAAEEEPPELPPSAVEIAKPSDDLTPFDSYQSASMFDSVRIMEPRIGEKADVQTQLHTEAVAADSSSSAGSEALPPDNGAAAQASASTSHNIGLGETDGKKSAKLKALGEGTILNGRYEIIRKIGGGGMGAVYLASDNNLGGVLRAVKEMVQTHIEEEQQEKAINDFKRESMILSSLDHVSIPTIYDYFYDEKESRFYLVMKYISGGDLSSRLRSAPEGRVEERTVCEWALQITDVLDYLHNQPSTIVYRDLKPSNIMIDGNSGRAMLIDFGIARSISQKEEKGVTAVGTMGYAPPELFSGNVEPRSDIYSLGSTMFHLLTGADPQSNPLLIFDFQKNPRPRQINPQLSDQIERILMKAVQYNSDQRFSSAGEMRASLEEHLSKLKGGIVTYGVGEVPASVSLSNQSVFCGFCGQRIVATDMFCAFCGAKQPIAQQGVHAEIYTQAGGTARLVVEGTSELSAPAFSLQKDDNLLGRRDPMSNIFPEVDLSKYDPQTKISRRHARIWREGNNFLLEDLGSSNGTILTRAASDSFRLMPKQPQVLAAGDRIRLGDAVLHFVVG